MAEKTKSSTNLHELAPDVEQFGELAHERREAIRVHLERNERHHKRVDREEGALEQATELAGKADSKKEKALKPSHIEHRKGAPSKRQRNQAFDDKMREIQSELDPAARATSRFIHLKPVEKTSDFVGSTIARPNAMLSGSIAAFIGVTALYFTAKYFGFRLSGFETIAAFIAGWVIGILYDYFSIMIRGRRRY